MDDEKKIRVDIPRRPRQETPAPAPESRLWAILLRVFWSLVPWVAVAGLVWVALQAGFEVKEKSARLKEEKIKALREMRPPINVIVQELKPELFIDKVNLPAEIKPWEDLTVRAQVAGEVIEVPVKEGDFVRRGAVLARLESADYRYALDKARADYELAKIEYERQTQIARVGAASKSLRDTYRTKMIEAKSALENAELQLKRCTITAPMSGFINRLDAKVGLLLNRSDPVAQLLDTRRVKVDVGIPESDIDQVRDLTETEIVVDALGGKKFTGRRIFLSRQTGSLARLYLLRLAVDNPKGELLPGMFARVDVVKKRYPDAVVIPLYSVIARGDERFVYVENGGTAHYRPVKLGVLEGWRVQITEGLKPGERVIIVGQRSLEQGQEVAVVRAVNHPEELMQ